MLKPRQPVPDLTVSTLDGRSWTLSAQQPQHFTMLAFYRGLHCPVCKRYLMDLNRKAADFNQRGVITLALSSDTAERAAAAQSEWGLDNLTIGYGLTIEKAREWGLFISTSRGKTSLGILEPPLFSEPGLFLIRPDMTLYAALIQTMPFARPMFAEVLSGLDFIIANDYPARGEA
ncbi:MAG: AhpC/TSA family protein [Ardenticatenaceae bacterium]|nr:AhpC/TSA family protein [Anaerolineales bacterium]MCB8922016.1 AhpC/TSA family protein [Ardenticatenaceae bacterium]MCB8989592.1 AhpC/TSA family protein [Ardenticatenaceae bacterium]MCB9003135.1 AhpC/TSA family protein [Ardenticatenaceae bacterium]